MNGRLSKEEILQRVSKSLGKQFKLITPITNQRVVDKVQVYCKKHKTLNTVELRTLWEGQSKGCKKCRYQIASEHRERTFSQLNKEIESIDFNYQLIYPRKHRIATNELLILKYIPLNLQLRTTFNSFRSGKRINFIYSFGERLVTNILDKNHIKYSKEYKVTINHRLHSFDFYLPDFSSMIEVDGKQHYEYTPRFYKNKSEFFDRIKRDREKNAWCKSNGIKMIRIPYKEEKITAKQIVLTLNNNQIPVLKYMGVYNADFSNRYVQISNFYLTHDRNITTKHFNISQYTLNKICMLMWGCYKQEYLDRIYNRSDKNIAEYYLNHSREQTVKHFKTSQCRIDRCFKELYGTTKSNYLGYHSNRFKK